MCHLCIASAALCYVLGAGVFFTKCGKSGSRKAIVAGPSSPGTDTAEAGATCAYAALHYVLGAGGHLGAEMKGYREAVAGVSD